MYGLLENQENDRPRHFLAGRKTKVHVVRVRVRRQHLGHIKCRLVSRPVGHLFSIIEA